MKKELFQPDYRNIEMSARNIEAPRLPLYEHFVSVEFMERALDCKFAQLEAGSYSDQLEFFRHYTRFFLEGGYDTVSYECCTGPIMPGSGALGGHQQGVIRDRADFEAYPWDELVDRYFATYADRFRALREVMPAGMKAVGGVGNGVFECVQDLVGYMDLCYLSVDDPELYGALFARMGQVSLSIWERFLAEFGDIYCVCRFGDDLGYKSNTLLPADDIRTHIFPVYKKIVAAVHRAGKPFLLHSCGCIFDVMDELIEEVGIDAKHSNEDQIALFPYWVETYGDRIGNFGGIDTDAVCRLPKEDMREYIREVVAKCTGHGGFAFGSGNSIPDYVPLDGYRTMLETIHELRDTN